MITSKNIVMKLIVTPQTKELGIQVCMAIIKDANVSNRSGPLEHLKKQLIKKITHVDISTNHILQGYRELYRKTTMQEHIPPSEHLITIIKKSGRMPNINTVVDCYNLVSAETFLSIGAHDIAYISGVLR